MQTEQINELAEALAKAQGVMAGAKKDEENPFFKSNYADLASVWNAIRGPLSDNGLSVVQNIETVEDGAVMVVSVLMHKGGQWIDSRMPVKPVKNDMQGLGAAISYARRYLLSAQCGVYQVDLDADEDQGKPIPESKQKTIPVKRKTTTTKPQADAQQEPAWGVVCPKCDKTDSIIKSKYKDGEFVCYEKKNDGCGFKFTPKPKEAGEGDDVPMGDPPRQEYISEQDRKKLFAKSDSVGWSNQELKDFLEGSYGIKSTKEIPAERFEEILSYVTN